jgi:hypothetical protein
MDNNYVSVFGRDLDEYEKMFNLKNIAPSTKIISIADGPSSFNVQLREQGINITSVDPIYNLSVNEIEEIFQKSYLFTKDLFVKNKENYNFKNEHEMELALARRKNTFNAFIIDYEKHRDKYEYGKLPFLKYEANAYDLCLCSNLLFLFDHLFDLEFHINSIKEMLRISKEMRLFPLYNINGKESKYVNPVIEYLTDNNYTWEMESNNYHIWKRGNRLLKAANLQRNMIYSKIV